MVCIAEDWCKCAEHIYNCFCPPIEELIVQRVRSFINLEDNWESLKRERAQLLAAEADLTRELNLEINQSNTPSEQHKLWQKDVANFYKTATTNEEYKQSKSCCCCSSSSCNPNICPRLQLSHKISKELKEVHRLLNMRTVIRLALPSLPDAVEEKSSNSMPVGIKSKLQELRLRFEDEGSSVIGVHGLGGVGKTTLLNAFNNVLKKSSEHGGYQVVIHVTVSNSSVLNVGDIQRKIAYRLGVPWNEAETEEFRAERLLEFSQER